MTGGNRRVVIPILAEERGFSKRGDTRGAAARSCVRLSGHPTSTCKPTTIFLFQAVDGQVKKTLTRAMFALTLQCKVKWRGDSPSGQSVLAGFGIQPYVVSRSGFAQR